MITQLIISVCALLGMLAVVETAQYYAGVDALAFNITLLMGAVLIGGVVELLWVSRRTARLREELSALPNEPSHTHVEGASPLLRALLSARLDRTALPVPGPVFAPFILSLLVMLGLLGTFLGLFETLRGAGHALDASADVQALRDGLKAPIGGLMRSFGTSAAGVASSAMLGLAAVFVRRDGGRFGVALHAVASGPLARFAPASRQLVALEKLAEQGDAWPTAAAALQKAVEHLDTLGARWEQAHANAVEQQRDQMTEATREIGEAIRAGVDRAATVGSEAVTPLLEQAARATGDAAAEHLRALRTQLAQELSERTAHEETLREQAGAEFERRSAQAQALQESATEQTKALYARASEQMEKLQAQAGVQWEERRTREQGLLDEVGARLEQWEQARADAERAHAEGLERFEQRRAEAESARDAARAQVLQAVADAAQARASEQAEVEQARDAERAAAQRSLAEAEAARVESLAVAEGARAEAMAERWQQQLDSRAELDAQLLSRVQAELGELRAQEQQRAEALASRFESLAQSMEQAFTGAAQRDEARAEALGEVGARMQRDLAEAASVVRERLTHSAEAEANLQQRTEQVFERLSEASTVIASSAETQAGALSAFVEATDGRMREAEQASQERLGDVLERWSALGQAQGERMAEFERSLLGQHEATVERLGGRLGDHAQTLDAHLAQSAELLREAAALVHGGGAELSAVAESFAGAVASQREGARQWLESLGDIERYALESGEAAAADALGQHLTRTHEVFDRQLQFQQELIEQLHGLRRRDSVVTARADAHA